MKKLLLLRTADIKECPHDFSFSKTAEFLNDKANESLTKEFAKLFESVTRLEVIDEKGRAYVNWKSNNRIELSLQDDNKTLKVFVYN